ncbi:hypothetical protein ONZ45_g1724 [Pleurotus djamor]|nr:hypothetical protein ONZ45_g1724 [Pleurotus djamor]
MGPAMAVLQARASALGSGLSRTTAPSLKREPEDQKLKNEADDEVYSEPDEGVEIIDLDNVHKMDWMAPESLQRLKTTTKKKKRLQEEKDGKGKGKAQQDDVQPDSQENNAEVDLANALDLSESEEEEEMEDLIDDFARANTTDETSDFGQDRLLWFQFPSPFPTFTSKSMEVTTNVVPDSDPPVASSSQSPLKKVAFAPDTKPPAPSSSIPAPPEEQKEVVDPKVDGIIGQLEVYQSGVVKIRLNNGILLDVTSATQPSFLQHAVSLDVENKRMCVLGEVNKRFIASPNVDMLLHALETAEAPPSANGEQDLVSMDVG